MKKLLAIIILSTIVSMSACTKSLETTAVPQVKQSVYFKVQSVTADNKSLYSNIFYYTEN